MSIANYIRSSRLVNDTFPSAVFAKKVNDEIIYKVRLVVPNVKKDDLEVYQEGDYLVISGAVHKVPDEQVVVTSSNYPLDGTFKKIFNIKGGEIENVVLKNGILEVTVKDTTIKRKKIEVQVSEPELLVETKPTGSRSRRTKNQN